MNSKKKIIIIVVAAVLVLAIAIGIAVKIAGGKSKEEGLYGRNRAGILGAGYGSNNSNHY